MKIVHSLGKSPNVEIVFSYHILGLLLPQKSSSDKAHILLQTSNCPNDFQIGVIRQ